MAASRIKHVSIKKLWGVKSISTDFHEHINIFIGSNGSSKTTFLGTFRKYYKISQLIHT